jgi:hypothetical protein
MPTAPISTTCRGGCPILCKLERLIGERPHTPLRQTLEFLVASARGVA